MWLKRHNWMIVWLLFNLTLLFFLILGIIEPEMLKENSRYFFSASAQVFAAIVGIIWIVHSLTYKQIPDYEIIFDDLYTKLFKRFQNTKKIKFLSLLGGSVIILSLFGIFFITNNLFILLFLILIDSWMFLFTIQEIFNFFITSLSQSPKKRFFNIVSNFIIHKIDIDDADHLHENIKKTISHQIPDDFRTDMHRIKGLLFPLFVYFIKGLTKKENIGSYSFYEKFDSFLDFLMKDKNLNIIPRYYHAKAIPNFKKHVYMCINDGQNGHHIKYIEDLVDLVVLIIDKLNRSCRYNIRDEYIELYLEIHKTTKQITNYHGKDYLYKIADSFAFRGLWDLNTFIKILDGMKISKERRVSFFESMSETVNRYYIEAGRYHFEKNEKELGVNSLGTIEEIKQNKKNLLKEINKLKKK